MLLGLAQKKGIKKILWGLAQGKTTKNYLTAIMPQMKKRQGKVRLAETPESNSFSPKGLLQERVERFLDVAVGFRGCAVEDAGSLPERSNRKRVGTAVISTERLGGGASVMAQCRLGLSELAVERIWSSGDSTAKARMAMLSPCLRFSSPSHSRVERQGGHQVAQNSTRTTRPDSSSGLRGLAGEVGQLTWGSAAISWRQQWWWRARELRCLSCRQGLRSIMRIRSALNFFLAGGAAPGRVTPVPSTSPK